jgi:energy-coupling factor transporter ATP-binding protein EcfA2
MTNIGVAGDQNDGKSTLVNCFRGVAHNAPESAMTGETEVTRRSAAYPDDRHIGVVWHDISGGGTTYNTAWGYYYNQKLFAYDKLVLAHSSTLSEVSISLWPYYNHYSTNLWRSWQLRFSRSANIALKSVLLCALKQMNTFGTVSGGVTTQQ